MSMSQFTDTITTHKLLITPGTRLFSERSGTAVSFFYKSNKTKDSLEI